MRETGKQSDTSDDLDAQAPIGVGLAAMEAIIGVVDDPSLPNDIAANHDRHLYGAPRR